MQMKVHPPPHLPAHLRNSEITDTNMAAMEMGTALWVTLDIYCIQVCARAAGNHGYSRNWRRILTQSNPLQKGGGVGGYFIL
jgi:hypothetical protein